MALNIKNLKLDKQSSAKRKEENRWNELIDAIMDGKVIPVIGPDYLIDDENDPDVIGVNVHQQIINCISEAYGIESEPKSFSQLVYDKNFIYETFTDENAIYDSINQVITGATEEKQLHPSKYLQKLLSLRKFPFVITTSFTPVVEIAMQTAWPEKEVKVLEFRNDPNFDQAVGQGDIEKEEDLNTPTVFYMFGKYSNKKQYVVTDLDMMNFCKSWIAGGAKVPSLLTEVLKKKYLLVLGNNYSDWLFRFILYSIRPSVDAMKSSLMVHDNLDTSLHEFLNRLQTFVERDQVFVINEIERRVNERLKQEKHEKRDNQYVKDVFLSYSRRDQVIVDRLYKALTDAGVRVWYDKEDIPGAANWKQTFLKGVSDTRLFIPVLSINVEKEYMSPHEYRDEWKQAASRASKMGGVDFIWPLAERGFEFYSERNRLPEEFQEKNASWYTIADDFSEFALKVKRKIDELKRNEEVLKND